MPGHRMSSLALAQRLSPYLPALTLRTGLPTASIAAHISHFTHLTKLHSAAGKQHALLLAATAVYPKEEEAHALRDMLREEMWEVALATKLYLLVRPHRSDSAAAVAAAMAALQRAPALTQIVVGVMTLTANTAQARAPPARAISVTARELGGGMQPIAEAEVRRTEADSIVELEPGAPEHVRVCVCVRLRLCVSVCVCVCACACA